MKCIALCLLRNNSPAEWCPPLSRSSSIFSPGHFIDSQHKKIINILNDLELNVFNMSELGGYSVVGLKINQGCCAIACDEELTQAQLILVARAMFEYNIPLSDVSELIEKYFQKDQTVEEIKKVLAETKERLSDAITSLIERQESLEVLLSRAQEFEVDSFKFRKRAEDLNSCWPKSCNIF